MVLTHAWDMLSDCAMFTMVRIILVNAKALPGSADWDMAKICPWCARPIDIFNFQLVTHAILSDDILRLTSLLCMTYTVVD